MCVQTKYCNLNTINCFGIIPNVHTVVFSILFYRNIKCIYFILLQYIKHCNVF